MEHIEMVKNWMFSFGEAYGVDPLIFAVLYFGTIPISMLSFVYLVKNIRTKRSLFWPLSGILLSFFGTYIYLFWAGKNIPLWVYLLVLLVLIVGLWRIYSKIKKLISSNQTTTNPSSFNNF